MGQEVLYCFKCRKRVVSADFAGGQAYQVGNNASCAACAAEFLQTLPPKDREALLARMFKATQERQKTSGANHAAIPERRPPSTQAQIVASRAPAARPTNPAIPIGLAVAAVVVLIIAALAFQHKPAPPPTVEKVAPKPAPPPNHSEARAAIEGARRFAKDHPDDVSAQIRVWEKAVATAERSPHYEDARRELGALLLRRKDAVTRDRADLDEKVRAFLAQEKYQAAVDHAQAAKSRHDVPEWAPAVEQKIRDIRSTAQEAYRPAKEKALRGSAADLEAFRTRVQTWGMADLIADLPTLQDRPWKSILGPGPETLRSRGEGWTFQNGALVKLPSPENAAQTQATFDDAELRIRFEIDAGGSLVWFAARQSGEGTSSDVRLNNQDLAAVSAGLHELLFLCNGPTVTATLDGKPVSVRQGTSRSGCLQFNAHHDMRIRIHSIEMRPLK